MSVYEILSRAFSSGVVPEFVDTWKFSDRDGYLIERQCPNHANAAWSERFELIDTSYRLVFLDKDGNRLPFGDSRAFA